ncbi:katanin p60 ATPase-containing subunit A-like 2 isoform X1 [Belonocnema kinseyi]|uniref:katanin p60 ATPase-containing subunit A-like 2 isoform X1 n=1 Tax=Belonocnema kinseyi TaxID=2817044 RepID=UPI00143D05CE|nr:katanin p60 ATPase-containing subunit A-like 2 isoform X1 [Belonocnema kinseyi]
MADGYMTANKMSHHAREKEEKRAQERRRNLTYLVTDFLREQGYTNTAHALANEARLSGDVQVCDNIDLDTILLEYSDYYFAKFNKYPKLCKKCEPSLNNLSLQNPGKKEKTNKNIRKSADENDLVKGTAHKETNILAIEPNLEITVTPIFAIPHEGNNARNQNKNLNRENNYIKEKVLKPIGDLYPVGSDWREIADIISKEIVLTNLNVHWSDVKGLDECKVQLKEATVYPLKYPSLFCGKIKPWRGILLYGPPGTGKTMLAKAVATECEATFFNVTSSSIVSKWRGETEKYIRVLLDLAKHYAPSIIFIDEIDWTAISNDDSAMSKSEPSRRFRAELLARLDGLLTMENANILLLAATNIPWDLDAALLRRLEKHIHVGLPDEKTRLEILGTYVSESVISTSEFSDLLKQTSGFSCADVKLLCKEAWMKQLRPIWKYLESNHVMINDVECDSFINKIKYLKKAMELIRPVSANLEIRYKEWNKIDKRDSQNTLVKNATSQQTEECEPADEDIIFKSRNYSPLDSIPPDLSSGWQRIEL